MLINLIKETCIKPRQDSLIGNYINCWVGQSTDERVRKSATSGGIVTSLLMCALNNRIVDGVLVTKICGIKPEVILAENENEIRSASGSKYCPVPLVASLKKLSTKQGKFAVVGLPCHIKAIRKLESLDHKLKDKIVLHVGLFCSHCVSPDGTKFLLRILGIKTEEVLELKYRVKSGGNTGMLIRTKFGDTKFIASKKYWGHLFNFFFIPSYCLKCHDMTSEMADVSVGDAWLTELGPSRIENCIFISRNSVGDKLVKEAISKGLMKCQEVSSKTVIRSQKLYLHVKKRTCSAYGLLAFYYLIFLKVCTLVSLKFRFYPFLNIWVRVFGVIK